MVIIEIKFYVNNSSEKVLSKNLTEVVSYECYLKDSTNILDPSIMLNFTELNVNFNYAYIYAFNRFYFVKDIIQVKNNLWQVDLKVDVLKTYDSLIRQQNAWVARQAVNGQYYITDDENPTLAKMQVVTKKFPNGFTNNGSYVLQIVGD